MLVIQDTLISEDVVQQQFHCNLNACKGACCWEGDYGAPVTQDEIAIVTNDLDKILPNLTEKSQNFLTQEGTGFTYYQEPKVWGTTCHSDGACVFLTKNELGISICGIEKTYYEGKIGFQKPISCHMYPIRVASNDIVGFEAWNYDEWDICSAACTKGKEEKMPIYRFVKDAIIRYKGQEFYEELDAAYHHLMEK